MKTSELTGAALDWVVAKCEDVYCFDGSYTPSTDWAQGGQIIEREDIAISPLPDGLWRAYAADGTLWAPHGVEVFNWTRKQQGYHPLIAAMRCYVASKLGDEVEIPEELNK
jgi:hypothetical protein